MGATIIRNTGSATPTPPLGSSALRMRRMRARRRCAEPLGAARATEAAAKRIRRRMIGDHDPYGQGLTRAIVRAMWLLADAGDPFPDTTLTALVRGYSPPQHPVAHLNHLLYTTLRRPVELAQRRRR